MGMGRERERLFGMILFVSGTIGSIDEPTAAFYL